MEKSTKLFLLTNLVLLLIPILLMLGLRFKISTGDIIDLTAQRQAEYRKDTSIKGIDRIVFNGVGGITSITIAMDTIDYITIDTASYKYLTYTISSGTLTVRYNAEADTINHIEGYADNTGEVGADYTPRAVVLHTTRNIENLTVNGVKAKLYYKCHDGPGRDLTAVIRDGSLNLVHDDEEDQEYYSPEYSSEDGRIMDSIPYKIDLDLTNAELDMALYYIKDLKVKVKNTTINSFPEDFGYLDLEIDEETSLGLDVHKLRKTNIRYIK